MKQLNGSLGIAFMAFWISNWKIVHLIVEECGNLYFVCDFCGSLALFKISSTLSWILSNIIKTFHTFLTLNVLPFYRFLMKCPLLHIYQKNLMLWESWDFGNKIGLLMKIPIKYFPLRCQTIHLWKIILFETSFAHPRSTRKLIHPHPTNPSQALNRKSRRQFSLIIPIEIMHLHEWKLQCTNK